MVITTEFFSDYAGSFRMYLDILKNDNISDLQLCNSAGTTLYGSTIGGYNATGLIALKVDTGYDVTLVEGWNTLYFKVTTHRGFVVVKRFRFIPTA